MSTAEATTLKKQRTALRAKVTSNARRLQGIYATSNPDLVNSALEALHKAYEDFSIIDLEYSELVLSDTEKYAEYLTVGNLDLEGYTDFVSDIYNTALSSFTTSSNKSMVNSCALAISDAKKLISELNTITNFDHHVATMLLQKASVSMTKHNILLDQVANSTNSDLALELGSYLSDLEFIMFKVELKVSNPNSAQPSDRQNDISESGQLPPSSTDNLPVESSANAQSHINSVLTPSINAQS